MMADPAVSRLLIIIIKLHFVVAVPQNSPEKATCLLTGTCSYSNTCEGVTTVTRPLEWLYFI